MNDKLKTAYRVSCLVSLFLVASAQAATNMPPLLRPVTLKDGDGRAEQSLVDPFRRRGADDAIGEDAEPGEDGLMRTTMGEISSEFRILAITIPQDTNTPHTALIQFYSSDEPILVHEGDLVRVDRLGAHGRNGRAAPRRGRTGQAGRAAVPGGRTGQAGRAAVSGGRNGRAGARPSHGGLADLDLEDQLKKYVFYLNVKHIEPTYIEVYHNKKRPDETIRLNW